MGRLSYALAAPAALCVAAAATGALAAQARAAIQGEIDPALRSAIERAIGETDRPITNRFEARRRARNAAEGAITVLRSEGYYAYVVEPEIGEGNRPQPVVRITPGPRFTLAPPKIEWLGVPPDSRSALAADEALALVAGAPGRAADVLSAEGRAVAAVRQRGYADVMAEPREVVVDHADRTVQAIYRISAGEIVRLDGVRLADDARTNPVWLRRLAPWRPGDRYDPDQIAQLERRLLETGVYNSVTVGLAPPVLTTPEGLRPILVTLAERKRRSIELGASYGTNEGPGFDARWLRYNALRRADTLALFVRGSRIDTRAGVGLTLPAWGRPDQTLTAEAATYREQTDAYDAKGIGLRANLQRRYTLTSYSTYGVVLDFSRTDELRPGTLTPLGRDILTLGAVGEIAADHSDNALNPTRGWRVRGRAEPTLLAGEGALPYLKLQTQGSAYLPLDPDARTVVAARLHLGTILNGTVASIPAPQRFYAGGGGSVRGFGYQDVGPRLPDDTPQGGRSLFEASAELRRELTANWGLAAFVDVGAVGDEAWPSFEGAGVGAGLGLRYNLRFGPLRLDVAAPVSGRRGGASYQVYVSIGQSF